MTSQHSGRHCLFPHIDPLCLPLQRPDAKALLELLVLVAVSENMPTTVSALTELAESCHHDVRWVLLGTYQSHAPAIA